MSANGDGGPRLLGEVLAPLAKMRPLPAVASRVAAASAVILATEPEEIAYGHGWLAQVALPYRRPPIGARRWERHNGNTHLLIEAGHIFDDGAARWTDLPLPYGARARLLLLALNREALWTRSRVVSVARTMTEALRELIGRRPNGRDLAAFREQVVALAGARVVVSRRLAEAHALAQVTVMPASGFELFVGDRGVARPRWPTRIALSEDYYASLLDHALPLDPRALAAMRHSALALDVYVWLVHRVYRVGSGPATFLAWAPLYQQFGAGFARVRDFRREFLGVLQLVCRVWPELRLTEEVVRTGRPAGIRLHPSKLPISPRG